MKTTDILGLIDHRSANRPNAGKYHRTTGNEKQIGRQIEQRSDGEENDQLEDDLKKKYTAQLAEEKKKVDAELTILNAQKEEFEKKKQKEKHIGEDHTIDKK